MDTERIKLGKPAQAKGGKDSTKIVLTAAGAVAAGTGAAVAANVWNNDAPEEQVTDQSITEENSQETTTGQTNQQGEQQGAGGNNGQQNQQTETEVQPVDNNQTVGQTSDITSQNGNESGLTHPTQEEEPYNPLDDVDPNLVAEEIIGEEIDPNDVDLADVVTIDDVDTVYMEDGTEMPVALVHDEDNEQYLMVDIDDDMTFDMIFDMEGNPIAAVDGNLTMSDVLDMFDETGDELAYNAEQIEQELADAESPEQDIIDTNDLAMLDRGDSEGMATTTAIPEEEFEEGGDDTDSDDDSDLVESDTDEGEMIDDLEA